MSNQDRADEILDTYDQIAPNFDAHAEHNAHNAYYDRPAMYSLLPDVDGIRALDAGCGTGTYSEWLLARGASVVAVDGSAQMIAHARAKLADRADIRQHDLREPLAFIADSSIDLVVSALVLDHIEELDRLFAEFHRLLPPGGLLVFSLTHPYHDFAKRGTNYFATEAIHYHFPTFGVDMPSYRRPLSAILDALRAAGFALDRLLEPQPLEECRNIDPESYEKLSNRPVFLCIRARKSDAR